MTVSQLIAKLNEIEDKDLEVMTESHYYDEEFYCEVDNPFIARLFNNYGGYYHDYYKEHDNANTSHPKVVLLI